MNKKFFKKALLLGVSAAALTATNLNADMHDKQDNGQEMMEHDMMKNDNNCHDSSQNNNDSMNNSDMQ